jgi:hypothetical protein
MGEVIELRGRGRPKDETRVALNEMLAQTDNGELHGSIHITDTDEGTRFYVLGGCRDRLQAGMLTLVRGLSHMVEEIAASGTAGNTPGRGIAELKWPKHSALPPRLEATNFGEME